MKTKDKKQIRKRIIKLRNSLNKDEILTKSRAIFCKLMKMRIYQSSKVIMCYMDFRNEVVTKEFINISLQKGKMIILPLIDKTENGEKIIIPCEIKNIESELEEGVLGIYEPKRDTCKEINPLNIDLIVVPGVAFDFMKNRIGYGAGYYDRFLKTARKDATKVGVAFELQILKKIEAREYDVPLDMIITEERIIL